MGFGSFLDMTELNRRFIRMQFGAKTRARTYRKLMSFLKNGVSLPQALKIMYDHATDDGAKPKTAAGIIILDWRRKIANGQSFGRAIAGWVPENDRIVIEAGEAAGSLATAIDNALFIEEGAKKIRNAIIGGLAYPVLLILVAIGFMVLFGVQIVPAFEEVLPRDRWTGTAAHMALVADFVSDWMPLLGAGLLALAVLITVSMPRWTGPLRARFDRLPPWSLYRLNAGAGFMLSVSALVKAGVQIPEVLKLLRRGANAWYHERVDGALRHVNNGINLGEALYRTRLGFPDIETVRDLRSFANLDGFDDTLELLGRQWMEESVERVRAQTSALRNASFILLGIVFAIIANGIFALQQQVAATL